MKRDRKAATFFIFIGLLLILVFAVGRIVSQDPSAFRSRYMVDTTLEMFLRFCAEWWIPAGAVGIPMFLIFFAVSLVREHRDGGNRRQGRD